MAGICHSVMNELDGLRAQAAPLWEKVKILRNRAFGHRSRAYTTDELFKEARVTPDNLKDLIATSKELLNKLSLAWQCDTYAFNADATKDTIRLLEDLMLLHRAKC